MANEFIQEFDREVPTADVIPVTAAPERKRLVEGVVMAQATELTPGFSSRQQLYQVAATFKVTSPEEYAGALIWENFVIGDKEDPNAEQATTWGRSIGGSRFRRYAERAKVPFGKMSTMVSALLDRPVVLDVYTKYEPPKIKNKETGLDEDNPYAGKVRRNIREFYAVGEKALQARGEAFTGGAAAPAAGVVADDPTKLVTCPVPGCGRMMPAADFPAHANSH